MRSVGWLLLVVLTMPLLGSAASPVPSVQAAVTCEGEVVPALWNETVQRHALVPFSTWGMDEIYEPGARGEVDDGATQVTANKEDALHPEEPWMYNPSWPLPVLEPLSEGHYITMEVGNDSVGALRLNLSSTHRTTFCVTLSTIEDNESTPVEADIYLMTASQYNRYEEVYRMVHGGWWFWEASFSDDDDNALSNIPPEWRSFDPTGWQSYRDVHQYERRSDATFSVTLDGPEVYSSFFGADEWQDFYLVIDAWDNTHDNDALAPDAVVVADVTVLSAQRSAVFPAWTVPLVMLSLFAALVLAPVVLNKRYMEAGLGEKTLTGDRSSSVPYLEQAPVKSDDVPDNLPSAQG